MASLQYFTRRNKIIRDKKVTGCRHVGFAIGKLSLTNQIVFFAKIIGSVDEERAVNVVYLDFHKSFDAVSWNDLNKLMNCRLDEMEY